MKKLLLFSLLALGASSSFAQNNCAAAIEILGDETVSVEPLTSGSYLGNCIGGTAAATPFAKWYYYTATADGEVTVNSDLPQNDGDTYSDDTRVSIITTTGTCTGYLCYGGSDDVSASNYLTTFTFPVEAGTTYYIVWDNRWSNLPFDFDFSFAEPSCIRPHDADVLNETNITTDSAQINWLPAIGTPNAYDVEYGAVDYAAGSGTLVNTNTTSATFSGITPSSSNKDYYLRSNCGAEQSAWVGPFRLNLAAILPFSNNFDNEDDYTNGFATSGGFGLSSSTTLSQSSPIFYFVPSSTTLATNASIFSRAISLQANEQVTMTFYTRLNSATGTAHTVKVYVNGTPTTTAATQLGADISVTGNTYALQTRTFTAVTPGTYYFIINDFTPAVANATQIFVDTVGFTSVLANDQFLASSFGVYPNPARSLVTVSNTTDALISNADIVDMNGRVVKSQKVGNVTETQINVSDLANGVYMMKISTDRGSLTKKLVIE